MSSGRDVVVVLGTIEGTEEDDLLPLDLIVDVTVDLGPTGDEEDTEIPRFESDATTAMTVIESSPSRTTLSGPVRNSRHRLRCDWHRRVRHRRRGGQYGQRE